MIHLTRSRLSGRMEENEFVAFDQSSIKQKESNERG